MPRSIKTSLRNVHNPWTRYAQNTLKLEKRYQPLIEVQIRKFRAQVIAQLKAHGTQSAQGSLQGIHLDTLLPVVQSIYKTAGLMGAKMTSEEVKKLAAQKAGGFGRNEQWIRAVQDYLKYHLLDLVQNMTDTMKEDIVKILEQGISEGWGIDRFVMELRSQPIIEARARVIARTEINRASNVGHSIAAQSMPYEVDKKWIAAKDHRTRHSHVLTNGHQTDELGTFKVPIYKGDKPTGQFDEMQFPGDPTAHVSNTANCRCRVLYVPKRDALGNIVMRNPNQATIIPMRPIQRIPAEQIAAILKANIHIGID